MILLLSFINKSLRDEGAKKFHIWATLKLDLRYNFDLAYKVSDVILGGFYWRRDMRDKLITGKAVM